LNQVSIVIIHHNRLNYLRYQLDQYKPWHELKEILEFILIDNSTNDIVSQDKLNTAYPWVNFQFLTENLGPSHSRNIGLNLAKGTFIQFIDDDDLITYEKLNTQAKFLNQNPDVDVVVGGTQRTDWSLTELPKKDASRITYPNFDEINHCGQLLETNGFFQIGAALFRKDALLAVNGFDEDRWLIEDVNLYLKLFSNKAKFKVDKNSSFGLFWRMITNEYSLSNRNQVLFLEGCLLNFFYCIDNNLLVTDADCEVTYSGIFNILNQDVSVNQALYQKGINILKEQSIYYLPKYAIMGKLIGFNGLFKLTSLYRKIKSILIKR